MKLPKIILSLSVAILSAAGISFSVVESSEDGLSKFTVNLRTDARPMNSEKLIIQESGNSDEEPVLFHFLKESDFVVEAYLEKKEIVGTIKKSAEYDIAERVAGFVYTFRVVKVLCSKELLTANKIEQTVVLQDFQMFVKVGTLDENYQSGEKYLFFLHQLAGDDKIFSTYELNKEKVYYHLFNGQRSLFTSESGGMHQPPTKGLLSASRQKYSELYKRIESFCTVLNENDTGIKFKKLKILTASDDSELKANAEYAIEFLRTKKN